MADNDAVWLDVLPSMRQFGPELVKGAGKAAKDAGAKAGKDYAGAFEDGADGAGDAAVAELQKAEAQASGLVKKLSGEVSRARQNQQRATAGVLQAEQGLATALSRQEQAARGVETATDALAAAVRDYGAGSEQAVRAEQALADARTKAETSSKGAQAAELKLDAARGKADDATRAFENAENGLREAKVAHKTATEQLTTAEKDLGGEVEKQPKRWSRVTDALGVAGEKFKGFAKGAGGVATSLMGAVGGAALFSEAWSQSLEAETSVDKLNASLAATPAQAERYGAVASNLYAAGWGESMTDVAGSVDAVVSSMSGMRDASAADIEKVTGYAMDLATAFDVDVAEAATTAGSLMKNGLAKDAEGAMDLIAGAMTQIPQSLRGEVLPVMDEYGKHFSALGIEGETAMGMIVAASGDGAIGMDKMGDALKEFTIRSTDMSKSTTDVYKSLGLNAKEMTNDLLAGGDTAESAMAKIVHGLQGIEDPGERAAASLALFGTPLEDLGTDKIPEFLGMVDPMGDAFDSMDGSAGKLSDTLNGGTAVSMEVVKRSFMKMLTDGIQPLLGPVNSFLQWAANTPGVMTAVAVALGGVALAWAAVTLAASPWLALGIGIAAAIGGVVLAIHNWGAVTQWLSDVWGGFVNWGKSVIGGFVNWWNERWAAAGSGFGDLWRGISSTATTIIGGFLNWGRSVIGGFVNWMKSSGDALSSWWNGMWASVGSAFTTTIGGFLNWGRSVLGGFVNWLRSTGSAVSTWWAGLWSGIGNFFRNAWNSIVTTGRNLLIGYVTWIRGMGASVSSWWRGLWSGIGNFFSGIWRNFLAGARAGFSTWVGWIRGAGSALSSWWSGLWSGIKSKALGLWEGLGRGVRNFWNNSFKPIFDIVGRVLKGDFVGAFNTAKEAVGRVWRNIANVVRKPINFVINTVYNDGIRGVFNKVAGIVGIGKLPRAAGIPAFARGGLADRGWALVGEEGPELVNFSDPGRVYTARETQAMLAGQAQAPIDALGMLAGSTPKASKVAAGGFWDDPWGNALNVGKGIWDNTIGKGLNFVRGKLADTAKLIADPLKDAIRNTLGSGGFGGMIAGLANKIIDGALSFLRGKDKEAAADGSGIIYDGPRGPFHRPSAGPFTSMYGPRWGGFHAGVDIAGGGPTFAAMDGVVSKKGWNIGPGRTGIGVLLNHGPGMYTYYGHNPSLGSIPVDPGDRVKGGQRIGRQGATGNVTGVHLHFETHEGRAWGDVNPMKYLRKYDTGGILSPGVTPILNATGRPEYVFTEPQWQILAGNLNAQAPGIPDTLYLVLEDGRELRAYVAETAGDEVDRMTRDSVRRGRQTAGAGGRR